MFFSFEGIDGSGKSTQAKLLAEAFRHSGQEVVEVREPGGTSLGEAIRSLLLDPGREIDERAELLLFSAARAQLVAQVIRPALSRGAIVIADRFFDSSTAYQGGGRGVASPEFLATLHRFATTDLAPRRTYLIDVPLAVAFRRRGERVQDRMEGGGEDFFKRVRDSYLSLASLERVLIADGTLPIAEVHRQVMSDAMLCRGDP